MGVNLTPIIEKQITSLEALGGKSFAVDAHNVLHQFLALIRTSNGTPLSDPEGEVTSHLVGLVFRTTRLIAELRMNLVFVLMENPPFLRKRSLRNGESRKKRQKKNISEQWQREI